MSRLRWLGVVSILAIGVGCAADHGTDEPSATTADAVRGAHVADELIIQYRSGATPERKAAARARASATVVDTLDGAGSIEVVRLDGISVTDAIARLARDPAVQLAEPNYVYEHQLVSNDPSLGSLWGLSQSSDVDIDAPEAWSLATGSPNVFVGVIDEGIDYRHDDLAGVVINPGEDADHDGVITEADFNGVDDDGNGKVDDVRGWDFVSGDNSIYDGKAGNTSVDAHGTHVAGTIGAIGNNGKGVVGVSWSVRIVSAKFLGRRGGTTANAIKAVDYLTDLKKNRGVNIIATNNSWGGGGYSQLLKDAIDRADAEGILFIAAAGNSGVNIDSSPTYPAAYSSANIIAVAAIDRYDALASWSNYGVTRVDVGAPGVGILSTTPNNTYSSYSGTSMATPHVTGLCALLASHAGMTGANAKSRILEKVVSTTALTGKTLTGGRINAYRALANATTDP